MGMIAKAQAEKGVSTTHTKTLQSLILAMKPQIMKALPKVITPEQDHAAEEGAQANG